MSALAVIAVACSDGADTASDTAASVAVGSIESGCAEAIDLTLILNGATPSTTDAQDMRAFADGASSLNAAFPDRSSEVGDYFNLISDAVANAADAAEEQGSISGEQAQLLLDFELAGRRADFDRLSPVADQYFSSKCGTPYANAVAGLASASVDAPADTAALAGDPADDTTSTTPPTSKADDTEETATTVLAEPTTTTAPAPPPDGAIQVDTSSVGATLLFGGAELTVGEIWRTNLTPEAAVTGGSEMGDQTVVLVSVRLTSASYRLSSAPNEYGFVSAEGFRTNADDAILPTGERWNLDLAENESVLGFLVFEGNPGALETGTLQWISDGAPANTRLGVGATTPPYPVVFETADPVASSEVPNINDCLRSYTTDVRLAQADLQHFDRFSVEQSSTSERFVRFDVGVRFDSVTGESSSCPFADSLSIRDLEVRLRILNGDTLSPVGNPSGSIAEGTTEEVSWVFQIPADATAFDLVDVTDTVLGSWTDIELPEP